MRIEGGGAVVVVDWVLKPDRGTSLIRKRPHPKDSHWATDMVLQKGPREMRLLISEVPLYRITSLINRRTPLGPYSRPTRMALQWSWGGGQLLLRE